MHGTKPDPKRTEKEIPLAYFITFRSYGTWLHGTRGSVDRFHNIYGAPRLPQDEKRRLYNLRRLSQPPVRLSVRARAAVDSAIRETCGIRKWGLWAFNIRTNHVHSVISANCQPGLILNAPKANATSKMRETGCWRSERSPWVRRGSKRYLWNERELLDAIAYVMYDQGEPLP